MSDLQTAVQTKEVGRAWIEQLNEQGFIPPASRSDWAATARDLTMLYISRWAKCKCPQLSYPDADAIAIAGMREFIMKHRRARVPVVDAVSWSSYVPLPMGTLDTVRAHAGDDVVYRY